METRSIELLKQGQKLRTKIKRTTRLTEFFLSQPRTKISNATGFSEISFLGFDTTPK